MSLITVAAGQPIRATHVNQFTRWITGATKDQALTLTTTSASLYTATLTNEDTSAGLLLKGVYGTGTAAVTAFAFDKTGATFNVPVTATGLLAGFFSSAGQLLYGTGGTGATVLNIGSSYQTLNVNSAGTAPAWMASLQSLMASAGSLVVASGANTPAHLPKGTTAFAEFVMNAGATGQTWASGALALAQTSGDTFYANGANSLARVAKGADGTLWTLSGGVPTWATAASVAVEHKNMLVNPTGRTKQRNTLPTTDNAYGFDHWRVLMENANGCTLSQETVDLPTPGPGYAVKLTVGSGNNGKFGHWQPILFEDMRDVAGGTVSVQVALKASTTALANVRIGVMQFTGTADSISGDPVTTWGGTGTNPTLAANWTFANTPASLSITTTYATYTVASISVTAAAVDLAVMVWNDARTTATGASILITDVQLERGVSCTNVERLAGPLERVLALSWYEEVGGDNSAEPFDQGQCFVATQAVFVVSFAPKRVVPSFSLSTATDFSLTQANATLTALTGLTLGVASKRRASLVASVGSSVLTAGDASRLAANTTNARLQFSAEP
jgi:hypothetical protein